MKEVNLMKFKMSDVKIHKKIIRDNTRINEVHILTDADTDG